jgi:hypothetical protein
MTIYLDAPEVPQEQSPIRQSAAEMAAHAYSAAGSAR